MNGAPASDYQFRPALVEVNASMAYECENARIYAGLSISEWDALPGIPLWSAGGRSKCDMIILYRMSNYIPSVVNDAQAREIERQSKRPGRR